MGAAKSKISGGYKVIWGAEHRKADGTLIVRMCLIEPPEPLTCLKVQCIIKFMRDCLKTALVSMYHQRRIFYAETNRNKKILERYRTGEPSPRTIWQAVHANIKLTCPVCRKYNVDPFLGKR
jgi:hypothetical protein